MRHFNFLTDEGRKDLFLVEPETFTKSTDKNLLSVTLGATLYIPATRPALMNDVRKMAKKDATSIVICLEDSIPDDKVELAEENLYGFLEELAGDDDIDSLPLVFVRPRTPEHFYKILEMNGDALIRNLTGFVFPKFDSLTASLYTDILNHYNKMWGLNLYYMPVLESPSIIYRETRKATLNTIMKVIFNSKDNVLAVRIGATDMSSAYGLRRSRDFTVYDVHVVSSAIGDIVNVFGRAEDELIITGAVWEHFNPADRMFKPLLREGLFVEDKTLRSKLVMQGYDTFIREIQLDKLNGIIGKTVIHPSHISIVHSLQVVTHEEYSDACSILEDENVSGGAMASIYRNKMNEVKPHTAWAKKTVNRAKMFGVANEKIEFVDFLERFNI